MRQQICFAAQRVCRGIRSGKMKHCVRLQYLISGQESDTEFCTIVKAVLALKGKTSVLGILMSRSKTLW